MWRCSATNKGNLTFLQALEVRAPWSARRMPSHVCVWQHALTLSFLVSAVGGHCAPQVVCVSQVSGGGSSSVVPGVFVVFPQLISLVSVSPGLQPVLGLIHQYDGATPALVKHIRDTLKTQHFVGEKVHIAEGDNL